MAQCPSVYHSLAAAAFDGFAAVDPACLARFPQNLLGGK